jgi:beta-galactosidase
LTRRVLCSFTTAARLGDIYTLNNYLNFIPLQEREEWLSNYVVNGEMPLAYVEFGTPVNISLMRGRNGFQNAYQSEPGLPNSPRSISGNEAYKLEPAAYRKRTAGTFHKRSDARLVAGPA